MIFGLGSAAEMWGANNTVRTAHNRRWQERISGREDTPGAVGALAGIQPANRQGRIKCIRSGESTGGRICRLTVAFEGRKERRFPTAGNGT